MATPAKTNRNSPSRSFLVAATTNKMIAQTTPKPTL
jgi:hypothetical protein